MLRRHLRAFFPVVLLAVLCAVPMRAQEADRPRKQKPLFRDFMGLCVHTVKFRPELYKPVCRLVRDYHGFTWDVGSETDFWPVFPFARNKVNWERMYGSWQKAGFEIDVSVTFSKTSPDK